jgi:hypothetical protein
MILSSGKTAAEARAAYEASRKLQRERYDLGREQTNTRPRDKGAFAPGERAEGEGL